MGDGGKSEEDVAAPKAGLGKRLSGYILVAGLLASLALMTISNPRHGLMPEGYRFLGLDRAEVGALGLVLFLGVLLFGYVWRKFVRHSPEEQRRIDEAVASARSSPRNIARKKSLKFLSCCSYSKVE